MHTYGCVLVTGTGHKQYLANQNESMVMNVHTCAPGLLRTIHLPAPPSIWHWLGLTAKNTKDYSVKDPFLFWNRVGVFVSFSNMIGIQNDGRCEKAKEHGRLPETAAHVFSGGCSVFAIKTWNLFLGWSFSNFVRLFASWRQKFFVSFNFRIVRVFAMSRLELPGNHCRPKCPSPDLNLVHPGPCTQRKVREYEALECGTQQETG